MGKVTFTNSKVNETISGESQKSRSHITSAGVFDTGSLAAETAENLKDSVAYVETVLREATNVSKRHLAAGERVTIDGLCRLYLVAADGTAHKLTVASSTQGEIDATVPDEVPAGEYTLEVTTFGLVGETTPRVFRKPVTLVEAIPEPEPFKVTDVRTDGEGGESGRIADEEDFAIIGLGFTDNSVANVRYTRAASGEEEDFYLLDSMIESREPGKIVVGSGFWESIGSSMDKTKKASFYVTESDPSTGEIVRRTNSFDAFVVDA